MKVFVAGATGVVGHRVVVRLVAAGFDVSGVAHSPHKRAGLVAAGVRPIEVDLFDHDAVVAAVGGHDAVVNLATAIPTGERASNTAAWATNDRIRREASHNLVDGAVAAGAACYVQESIALLYADGGDRVLDESSPVAPTSITDSALAAETEAERFASDGSVGVTLRFGQFYGFDSVHSVQALEAVRAGRPAELGPPSAYRSSITTDDAASAVVAALRVPSGVYSVIDDQPLSRASYVDALADALGRPAPALPSLDIELAPEFSMLLRSQRVSNERFKAVSDWRPASPSVRDGWPVVVAAWRENQVARVG
jgi:nucleoside-diphosphate-sugar epimerase